MNPNEQRKIDPEGLSLIGFHYSSNNVNYHFHLPYRSAEQFLSAELLHHLRGHTSQQRHEYATYGRFITAAESESYPIEEILHVLGVNIGNYVYANWNAKPSTSAKCILTISTAGMIMIRTILHM